MQVLGTEGRKFKTVECKTCLIKLTKNSGTMSVRQPVT